MNSNLEKDDLEKLVNNYIMVNIMKYLFITMHHFIYLHYNDFYWPAFNFADIYITIGVLLILYNVVIDIKKLRYDKN